MKDISLYVATHQKINLELPDIYKICQVNAEMNGRWKGNYAHDDDSPDNISIKNEYYCELTALYELWKNNQSEIKGLCHYRRFFTRKTTANKRNCLERAISKSNIKDTCIDDSNIIEFLSTHDLILQYPIAPAIVNAREDLLRFVFPHDIRIMDEVIEEYYPEYLEAYHRVMDTTFISYFNMLIGRASVVDNYCEWLFNVLQHIEKRVDLSGYDKQHKRIYGYLAEVLLNVYAMKNLLKIKYTFVVMTDEYYNQPNKFVKQAIKILFPGLYIYKNHEEVRALGEIKHIGDCVPYIPLEKAFDNNRSLKSLRAYYSHIHKSTLDEREVIGLDPEKYFVFLVTYGKELPYRQSNARCIAVLETESINELVDFEKETVVRFGSQYTINLRVITKDNAVKEYCNNNMIYVYA